MSLRMAETVHEDLIGRRVIDYRKAVSMSADAGGTIDPARHVWIGWGEGMPAPGWEKDTPFPDLPVRHRLFSNLLQVEAVRHGLGLALLPCFLGDTEAGLKRVPGTPTLAGKSIWVLFHSDLEPPGRAGGARQRRARHTLTYCLSRTMSRLGDSA